MSQRRKIDDKEKGNSRAGWRGLIHVPSALPNIISQHKPQERARGFNLLLDLKPIYLSQGDFLTHSYQQISHVYFPTSALVALAVEMEDGEAVEAGFVGAEGMVNLPIFWGEYAVPYSAITFQEGHAFRMDADVFRREVKFMASLHQSLMRYTSFSFICAAQRAACNCRHSVKQRVADLILVMLDYLGHDSFETTHDLMAGLLGVRRSGVTVALNEFKDSGMIKLHRRQIEIMNPKKLESLTCECYQIIKAELKRLRNSHTIRVLPRIACSNRAILKQTRL
jgi:CRP-like cAMP-binding protein